MGHAARKFTYSRRRPQDTVCYRVIQDWWDTFKRDREQECREIPEYIEKEIEAFLECGILAYGFLRIQCQSCRHANVVAFSCKKRGLCPSYAGKSMAETAVTAVHMVDHT